LIHRLELRSDHADFEKHLREEEELCDAVVDCGGAYLAPGLIDLHCHGAMGRDTMEATTEAFEDILNFHASKGTTLAVLTTVAASLEDMERVLVAAEEYQRKTAGSRFAGIHLEGPYFSPYRRGAHREEMLRHPSACETKELLRHAGVIARMTLAPELPGSLELIRVLVQHGITASAGHSNATEEEALKGFQSGCTQVTHLYNCMSSLRSEGGVRHTGLAEAALTNEVLCEVIADGRHLSPTLLRLAWLSKRWDSVAIVSDATAGTGLPEGSPFELGGLSCVVEQGAAWTGEGADRRLAGSTIGMIDGVRVMVEQVGVPLGEAVAMASLTPARSLGVDGKRGSLEVGKRADLLQFSADWQVEGVWSIGSPIG
jgi:N-acetylglucosamine-6-phosphate deacetylase